MVKPASSTPLSALALREVLVDQAGLPADWYQLVPGASKEVGPALIEHERTAMVSFTGSAEVGWGIRAQVPRKKVGLELGNNAAVLIEPSADLAAVAKKLAVAGTSHAGQSCISTQRVLVHQSVHDELVELLAEEVAALVVGDPLDPTTDVSSLISSDDRDRVKAWIDEAVGEGAGLVQGGVVDGSVLTPAVVDRVAPSMKLFHDEVFGPVLGVTPYASLDEGIRLANDTRYGLQAAIFTADLAAALEGAKRLDFGGVLVNEVPTFRADHMPYGGLRDSGNTREGPAHAVHEMTEPRLIVLQAP